MYDTKNNMARGVVDQCYLPLAHNHVIMGQWLFTLRWGKIPMIEDANQGCPLSAIFAVLVLDRALRPNATQLKERTAVRLAAGTIGDNGQGSVVNLFGYADNAAAPVC